MEKSYYQPSYLLGTENAKTNKGLKEGYTTYIMYLAPFTQNSKGINLCSHASDGCAKLCLFGAGRGKFNSVEKARLNKTDYFLQDRQLFLTNLVKEVNKIVRRHDKKGTKFAIRLNGTSDIRFEKFKIMDGKNIFELFPNVTFYDYTKNHVKLFSNDYSNYHLTFSRSEDNDRQVSEVLRRGYNVAMVFDKVPTEYNGYKVIDGDKNDLRFLDPKNVIVGLKYKRISGVTMEEVYKKGFVIKAE